MQRPSLVLLALAGCAGQTGTARTPDSGGPPGEPAPAARPAPAPASMRSAPPPPDTRVAPAADGPAPARDATEPSPDAPPAQPEGPPTAALSFRAHPIDRPGGTNFGQTSLVDVDRDGDLDFVSGARAGNVYWFEYQSASTWVRHVIGGPARSDVGGIAFDVDGDGWIDQVSGGDWYRNPGQPRTAAFVKHPTGIVTGHDNIAADLDGDRRPEVIALSDSGLWWYQRGADPTKPWTGHALTGRESPIVHGGVAAGDLDGDGDVDLSRVDRWFENADGKGRFVEHRGAFAFGRNGPFGIQTRALVLDLDGDGDRDLVQSEGDILDGRVAWFENRDGKAGSFTMHLIRGPGHKQDFHSQAVADFDGDGDPDVFSCGGPLTDGPRRWLVWQNGGRADAFREQEIHVGPECHEAVAADVDRDGDVDLCSKPWAGDAHVYLENRLR